jgi:hypothetical protein
VDDPHVGADDPDLDGQRGRGGGSEPARQLEQVQRVSLRGSTIGRPSMAT